MDRTITDFQYKLTEVFKNAKWDNKYDFLHYHQNIARLYIKESKDVHSRGILIYHTMGMGKSILASAIASDAIETGRPVIMLMAKSIQENMRGAIRQYINLRKEKEKEFLAGINPEQFITDNFKFVTMGTRATIGNITEEQKYKGVSREIKRGSLLVVDEAHNLFRSITNGSANALELYSIIMRTKDLKLIFLTGTPFINDAYEIVPCFNMLNGKSNTPLLPESYDTFYDLFVNEEEAEIKNREKLQNRLFGLISYVNHNSTIGALVGRNESVKADFPEDLPNIIEKILFNEQQFSYYAIKREIEIEKIQKSLMESSKFKKKERGSSNGIAKPQSTGNTAMIRIKSRMACNFAPPLAYRDATLPEEIPLDQCTSPKFEKMYEHIESRPNKLGIVYSQFTGIGGLGVFERFLQNKGYTRLRASAQDALLTPPISLSKGEGNKYIVITGAVSEQERKMLLAIYNSPDNARGQKVSLMLTSMTGAEGLDAKNVLFILMMEPFFNYNLEMQLKARGLRIKAHQDLKPEERKMQFINFHMTHKNPVEFEKETTDEYIYQKSKHNQKIIDNMYKLMQEVSIECVLNKGDNCRVCHPDGRKLFTEDIRHDVKVSDPCKKVQKSKVSVSEVLIDDQRYLYRENPEAILGFNIYEFSEELNGYQQIAEDDPRMDEIITAIQGEES